jgi:NAD(P)-dependent dehydrogenase (short-subunit alcohol dehydrogenase family)
MVMLGAGTSMETGLDGKVVLITGAGRNIGRATALMFAEEGARLLLSTRHSGGQLDETAEACKAAGAEVSTVLCDVGDREQVTEMIKVADDVFGGVDVLVNNATSRVQGSFLKTSPEQWRTTMAVNLDGPFHTSQAIIPGMMERGWGRIINYSGVSPFQGGSPAKAAAKMGIIGFTRGIANEFGRYGITANCIAPGQIQVERDPGMERESDLTGEVQAPIPRFGTPEEIAALVIYLSSKHADYITGQCFAVNGGAIFQ